MVKETTKYDNCLDIAKRTDDVYGLNVEKFIESEEPTNKLVDQTKAKKKKEKIYKEIYLHFRCFDDLLAFCKLISKNIPYDHKELKFPLIKTDSFIDERLIKPRRVDNHEVAFNLDDFVDVDYNEKWQLHWKEMPEFIQEENNPYRSVTLKFKTKDDYVAFAKLIDQPLSDKTKAIWYPKLERTKNFLLRWRTDEIHSAKYPVYIVSKGRYDSMITSKSLNRMRVPHFIVIEPQEEELYKQALVNFDITCAQLLIAPFSNHGDGPGRARNWAWDHSMSFGAERHWVLDDNIADFYRLHENIRIRVDDGAFFRIMEDFVDRYENIPIAGPQYRFFIAPNQKYPPYVTNTRIYSTLLIDNKCKHRWRGRYNEDTDICLRVLKDGDCTVQFNAFLQGKSATQTVKGGNTQEFYHVEGTLNKEKWRDGQLNSEGTINKSQMLVDMHPDVTRLVWRYGRWHHWVDYDPFKKNKLKLKPEFENLKNEVNNYGLTLITLKEE